MQQIGIGVYNSNLEFIGQINLVENLQVISNLQSASTISFSTRLTSENISLLNTANSLILNRETTEEAEVFRIQYVQKQLNADGTTNLVIQGYNLFKLLEYRVLTKLYNFTNANVGDIITEMLNYEVIDPVDSDRQYPNWELGDLTLNNTINYINPLASYSNPELNASVGKAITNVLQAVGIGLQVKANLNTKVVTVSFITGQDLTINSEADNPIILNNVLNNITTQEFTTSTVNYTNVCYVSGTVKNTTEQVICFKGSITPVGYARKESSTECEIEGLNSQDYISQYKAIGQSYIATQDIFKNSSVDLNIDAAHYNFNSDFRLGDLITFISEDWNINESIEISQVTETWSNGGYSISLQLGKQQPTLAKILGRK